MTTTSSDARVLTLVLVALALFVLLPLLFMGSGMMGYMGFGSTMGPGGMWGGGTAPGWVFVVGAVTQLLFLTVLIGGAYLVYRTVARETAEDDALAELRLAYARGDLDDDEYERRRAVLERK